VHQILDLVHHRYPNPNRPSASFYLHELAAVTCGCSEPLLMVGAENLLHDPMNRPPMLLLRLSLV